MSDSSLGSAPVKAKAYLIEASSRTIVWMNESAAKDLLKGVGVGASVERALPLSAVLGLQDALRETAETGLSRHLRADIFSSSRGTLGIAVSVYRLPDGLLLLMMEESWKARGRRR